MIGITSQKQLVCYPDTHLFIVPPDNFCPLFIQKEPQLVTVTDPANGKNVKCLSIELPEGKMCYAAKLEPTVRKMINSRSARELLNRVLSDGPIYVFLGNKATAPSGGSWRMLDRTIFINMNESDDRKLGHLLFEMANALQSKQQLDLSRDVNLGIVSKELYVKRWEAIEYKTAKAFISAIQPCIQNEKWAKETDMGIPSLFDIPNYSWKKHWKRIKDSNHADFFRRDWENICREVYCHVNPKAIDCR